jgi:hypothetical protein
VACETSDHNAFLADGHPPIKPPPWAFKMIPKSIQLLAFIVLTLIFLFFNRLKLNQSLRPKGTRSTNTNLHYTKPQIQSYSTPISTQKITPYHPRPTQHHIATQLFFHPTTKPFYLPQPP